MNPRFLIHAGVLGAFCLGFGILLAVTDRFTAADIALRALDDRQNSLSQVLPAAIHDNNPIADAMVMRDEQGQELTIYRAMKQGVVTGVAYEVRASGYAGAIKLMLGVAADGRILGTRVLAHKETPGLGDKIEAKKGNWILQFAGLSLNDPPTEKWKVKKDGGHFDQFTGATITPRGVVEALRQGLVFFNRHRQQLTQVNP